ncbi:MAG: c-type cytochrome [Acidobacteriota bacterium]|nr:c-type cytochrome [Acidobacteriota bacterium]
MTDWKCAGAIALALSASPIAVLGQTAKIGTPAVTRGAAVYAAQKCSKCHGLDGKGNQKQALDSVGSKITAEEIRLWIVDPVDMAKKTEPPRKTIMKAYANLPKEDLAALVAFLAAKTKK